MKNFRNYKSIKQDLGFVLILIIISILFSYQKTSFMKPYSIHQWRQMDAVSFTQNYYEKDLSFFNPEVNWVGEKDNNKTVSEFPLIYFLVSIIWSLFGKNFFWIRIINLILLYIALFSWYRLNKKLLSSYFWACFSTVFLFTSPILVYYGNNYLMDAPAFSLALTASALLLRYFMINSKRSYLIIGTLLFALAGLLKITALVSFIAIFAFWLLRLLMKKELFPNFNSSNKNLFLEISSIAFVLIINISWYLYAISYNRTNISGMFLQDLFPIWKMEKENIHDIFLNLYHKLLPSFFNYFALALLLLVFFTRMAFKRMYDELFFISIIIFVGVILYILFWFKAFTVHDYYLLNMLIFIPFLLLSIFTYLKKHTDFLDNKFFKVAIVIMLVFMMYSTIVKTQIRYTANPPLVRTSVIISKEERAYWKWYHWDYSLTYKALENITPYLREIGVKPEDKVISIPDQSPNISLTFMNQYGYTDFGYSALVENERIDWFIDSGAKYLIINNASIIEKRPYLSDYTDNKIGQYENVSIYKLNKNNDD